MKLSRWHTLFRMGRYTSMCLYANPYPQAGEKSNSVKVKIVEPEQAQADLTKESKTKFTNLLAGFTRILVIAGQQETSQRSLKLLPGFAMSIRPRSLVMWFPTFIRHQQQSGMLMYFLHMRPNQSRQPCPDLIITFGKSVISKHLKQFYGNMAPTALAHTALWHCSRSVSVAYPNHSLRSEIFLYRLK